MMNECGCSILGPVCAEGQRIFEYVRHAHDVAVGRVALPVGVGAVSKGRVWRDYQMWHDAYLAHIDAISWDEWDARYR